ncbi:DUF3040 domain-containing protein [Georgenia sunbinii]|uniref:DUF3040 domain-containing protein n=1 Tax=Georgenia sunbinii TaxID=3117728 RepID=UPI002F268AE5
MPLSEYEQRVLHQMEQQLRTDDPRFASSLASESRYSVRRLTIGTLLVALGLTLLVAGVATSLVWLGVLGFVAMLGGVMLAISKQKSATAAAPPAAQPAKARSKSSNGGSAGFMQRLEDRWDKRRDNRGH